MLGAVEKKPGPMEDRQDSSDYSGNSGACKS